MEEEKFFYLYQSLELKRDKDNKDIIYAIENLANSQLFFNNPVNFNDPYDSRAYCFYLGKKEQFIESIQNAGIISYEQAAVEFGLDISNELVEERGEYYYAKYSKIFKKEVIHGDIPKEKYPKICCFSETCKSILMWSHYADRHKGICLRFRSAKDLLKKEENKYYLEFVPSNIAEVCQLVINELDKYCKFNNFGSTIPSQNIFYKIAFQKVDYKNKIPEPVNLFDEDLYVKLHRFLLNKFKKWEYEKEYRLIIDPTFDEILISEKDFDKGLFKYRREHLEGIIFGLKINRIDAQDVYDTIKKHYLDEGVVVNFYKVVEIERKYDVKIEPIIDIDEYIKSRPEATTSTV